jgi:predicted aconitase
MEIKRGGKGEYLRAQEPGEYLVRMDAVEFANLTAALASPAKLCGSHGSRLSPNGTAKTFLEKAAPVKPDRDEVNEELDRRHEYTRDTMDEIFLTSPRFENNEALYAYVDAELAERGIDETTWKEQTNGVRV